MFHHVGVLMISHLCALLILKFIKIYSIPRTSHVLFSKEIRQIVTNNLKSFDQKIIARILPEFWLSFIDQFVSYNSRI